ncbi:SIP domain-containing protein [Longispora sp. NPDC051575]|uniref:SIP domain-containing protein n=1 Tax=Longispora sp. NPDC051575 TaxID=3154943 RepID=UPI003433E187
MPGRSPRTLVTFPIVLRELTVLRVTDVHPGLRRITLGGAQLRAFHRDGLDLPALRTEGFDDHVKFFFTAPGEDHPVLPTQNVSHLDWPADARPIGKDYTPRRYDPEAGEIDFEFVRHGWGHAATWAERAAPGQTAWIAGPKMSHSHPAGVDWILALGDETALPAIARWLEEMPADTVARVFVEVADASHRQDLPTRAAAEITWLYRDGAPAGTTDLLERAVRGMDWLPGAVFVWAAGEAGTLKGVRRHLKVDREVPRDHTDITGYWRRTEAARDDATHERLHALTDLAPGFAIRAAVTLGLVDLVHAGVADVAALADRTGSDPAGLEALLAYLVAIDVFAVDGSGRHRLTPLGEELAEDDHSHEEYHLDGARAALDLSLAGLVDTVRTGRAGYRTSAGVPLATAIGTTPALAVSARSAVEETALWVAPAVVTGYDWSTVPDLTGVGNGAGAVVNALVGAHPGLRATIAGLPSALDAVRIHALDPGSADRIELTPRSGLTPPAGAGLYLFVRALDWLTDADAVLVLAETAGLLDAAGRVLLVEECRPEAVDDVDVLLHDLRLRCAFGSGLRAPGQVEALAGRAGLTVLSSRDLGWDHRLWVLARAAA